MTTVTTYKPNKAARTIRTGMTAHDRLRIAESVRGTWKRPLKQSLRELTTIRRGLDRKLP